MPPQFDGKTSQANYLLQLKAAAKASEKATLTVALRGDVVEILQSLTPEQRGDYNQLISQLEQHYGYAHMQNIYRSQLRGRFHKNR